MSTGFLLLALANSVDELTDATWHTWKDDICVVLGADGESGDIVNGTTLRPSNKAEAAAYDKKDKATMSIMWARLSKDVHPLAKGIKSSAALYKKLKDEFQKSTWSRRVALRTAF